MYTSVPRGCLILLPLFPCAGITSIHQRTSRVPVFLKVKAFLIIQRENVRRHWKCQLIRESTYFIRHEKEMKVPYINP